MTTTATVNSSPITATVAGASVSASVASSSVSASASGGVGPRGTDGASGASTWSEITSKPSTFPPSIHTHSLLDVTGLQDALAGKQAAGSYAAASHTHSAADVTGLATVATTGSYADLSDKPTIPAAVTSLPAASITGLATVATSGSYADLSDKPTIPEAVTSLPAASITGLAAVATTGSYSDLANKPTIPSVYSLPVATSSVLGGVKQGSNVTIAGDGTISVAAPVTALPAASITGLATVATSGAYSDLSGRPALGTAAAAATTDFAASSHTHSLSSLTQSSATTGQVVTWNGSAWAPATPSSSGSSVVSAATAASFPPTGTANVLYLASDESRLYRWESTAYVEIASDAVVVDGGTFGA